jgi:hypothetical protein
MSHTNYNDNTIYHADYHAEPYSHKEKQMDKHNKTLMSKKILQFKKKNNIGSEKWISAYDIYKSNSDKKHKRIYTKNMRSKGYDYKIFVANNNIYTEDESVEQDLSYDCNWDYYSEYDCDYKHDVYWLCK